MTDRTIIDCVQGTDEWFAAKLGKVTASEFHKVLAKGEGKTRRSYMLRLAAERLTGQRQETYQNDDMLRGQELEAEAREYYEQLTDTQVERVGFISWGEIGCSPDGLIGTDGGLELKCPKATTHIEYLLKNQVPPEYAAQIQGSLWVSQRKWWDFVSYAPEVKDCPMFQIRTVEPDKKYIMVLSAAVDQFIKELNETVNNIKRKSF